MPCNPISWSMWRAAHRPQPRFDLVHATAFPYAWPIVCGLRLARRQRIPFLLTPFLHLGDPEDAHDRTRRAYMAPALMSLVRQADGVFAQTELERAALLSQGIDAEKVVRLGMGVEPGECTGGDRVRVRRQWQIQPGETVVGHLANLSYEKGTLDLLHAVQRAWQQGQPIRLVLAGAEMPNFRRFWPTFAPLGPVLRLGVLTDDQKRDFFAGLDILTLPSRSDSFGLVVLEAWANGVPTVAYRAGGLAEVIRHRQDGWLVSCGDVPALAAALTALANDHTQLKQLGQAGQERLAREFRWGDKLRQVAQRYRASERGTSVGQSLSLLSASR